MTGSGCRVCGKAPKVYAVISWADLGHWCSTECWISEEKLVQERERQMKEKEDKNRDFLLTGVKYFDPTGR